MLVFDVCQIIFFLLLSFSHQTNFLMLALIFKDANFLFDCLPAFSLKLSSKKKEHPIDGWLFFFQNKVFVVSWRFTFFNQNFVNLRDVQANILQ